MTLHLLDSTTQSGRGEIGKRGGPGIRWVEAAPRKSLASSNLAARTQFLQAHVFASLFRGSPYFMKPGLMPAAARSSAIRCPLRRRTCLVSDAR